MENKDCSTFITKNSSFCSFVDPSKKEVVGKDIADNCLSGMEYSYVPFVSNIQSGAVENSHNPTHKFRTEDIFSKSSKWKLKYLFSVYFLFSHIIFKHINKAESLLFFFKDDMKLNIYIQQSIA